MSAAAAVRSFDHTGDVGFEVVAADLPALFDGARRAVLAELMTRPPRGGDERLALELEAHGLERLLLRWLDEVLFLVQTRARVPTGGRPRLRPAGSADGSWRLDAELTLTPLDPVAHGWRGEVKAATYHGLELARDGEHWRARVVLDV